MANELRGSICLSPHAGITSTHHHAQFSIQVLEFELGSSGQQSPTNRPVSLETCTWCAQLKIFIMGSLQKKFPGPSVQANVQFRLQLYRIAFSFAVPVPSLLSDIQTRGQSRPLWAEQSSQAPSPPTRLPVKPLSSHQGQEQMEGPSPPLRHRPTPLPTAERTSLFKNQCRAACLRLAGRDCRRRVFLGDKREQFQPEDSLS